MKCPLILMAYLHRTGEVPTSQADCFKEECAWFNPDPRLCVVFDTMSYIAAINQNLIQLIEIMPHKE